MIVLNEHQSENVLNDLNNSNIVMKRI